jgi:recombinational DNA repair protein RecR
MFEDAEKTFAFRPTYEERLEILAEFLHVPHSQVQNVQRAVAIPRTSLDKCDICGSAEDLRICSRCVSVSLDAHKRC